VATYDLLADLPVEIESYELERLEQPVSTDFTRVTTVIHLSGGGEEGVGEDVTYTAEDQTAFQEQGRDLPITGTHALDSFSELIERLELFPSGPAMEASRDYRRWAFESAALDLALRQAGRSLGDIVGREARPVRYVVSMRLADPPSTDRIRRWLDLYPGLEFKLDPQSSWDDDFVAELASLGVVESLDLKGQYEGTIVDQPADPALYQRLVDAFPDAYLEDPALTEETDAILEPHRDRITWDAIIHSVGDIVALPFPPRALNIKPSRFASLRRLTEAIEYCAENGIRPYGGGQFELGPGRGQIQYHASLFHPDTPNDVAPGGFNMPEPRPGLPPSPLEPRPEPTGFRWRPGPEPVDSS
jgi:L-alanine-DL-glutamate epimerase-like enolase superfamily enzyme